MTQMTFRKEFTPVFVEQLKHYTLPHFGKDMLAGITVGIVAIPLALAFAIASGVQPGQGLITAIIAGFIISAMGGSRTQIGGPTGAFIVILAGVVSRHGYEGLAIATAMAGVLLLALGLLRLGRFIRLIPMPVIIGFTAGIAAIIFSGQIKDFFGLAIAHPPAEMAEKWVAYAHAAGTAQGMTTAIGLFTVSIIVIGRSLKLPFPPAIIGVVASALLVWGLQLPVETITSRFGGIPREFPPFQGLTILSSLSMDTMVKLLPDALAIAMLGGIESLLSALVADGLTGDKHKSNIELVAQGIANIASVLFGGIAATGAIARTGTNIKSGAQTPVSGMVHALFLLGVMLFLAPMAGQIPLAALAGVLFVVSWDMSEKHHVWALLKKRRSAAIVMTITLLLTMFVDLTYAVVIGTALGLAFAHRHRLTHLLGARETTALFEQPEVAELAEHPSADAAKTRVSVKVAQGKPSTKPGKPKGKKRR